MTNIKKSIVYILVLLTFAACRVSKDVVTPEPQLPATFRNAVAEVKPAVADLQWKKFITEPSLQKLVEKAIAKNYDMQLALRNIESAQLLLKQSKWAYLPDARLQVLSNFNRPSDNSLNGLSAKSFLGTTHVEDFSANISLSWEADIWGKIKNQKAGALAVYLQSEEAAKWIQTNIISSVSEGFYNLLMLDAQLAIAQRNISLNDSTLGIIRLQFNAGQVTALAVQQAQAQQLTARVLVPQLEKEITIQENALSILAGELPAAIRRSVVLRDLDIADNLSAGLPSALLSRRPDVKNFELALVRANAQVGISRANMYPTLAISASGGVNSFKATNWFNIPAALFGVVAGGLVQPLVQKKQLSTAYQLAKVDREKTVLEFRQSVLNAVGEVSNALVRIEKLKTEQEIALERVNTLKGAITNAGLLFRTGMATYLEVIIAQSNALQSELELAAITREQLSANVELYRSLGGG